MIHSSLTLVVNLSLRSIRTIIFNDSGKKIHEDWMPVQTVIDGPIVEQDPNEWWSLLLELLKKVFSDNMLGPYISYVTVTSSSRCLVLLDKKGNILSKSLMVADKRSQKESMELQEKFSVFFSRNQSFVCDSGYFLPKILWLKRNEKKISKKIDIFLSSNDFFVYKFTNKRVTDTLNAEKFYYDIKKREYPVTLLKYVGISEKNLPSVIIPGTVVGSISTEIKKTLGIHQDIKLIISTYDAIAALIGSSTHEPGELNNVCGTCSSYRFFIKKPSSTISSATLLTQELTGESVWVVGASNNLEGGVLEWAKECFYGDSYLKDDNFLYVLMQTEAQESELGARGLIFLPYLLGERMPFSDPDVRGTFFGLERFHTRRDIIRSIFEATAFQAKLVMEEFSKAGYEISSINMSGGVAKMPFVAQLRADVLGVPVNVLEEVETTALGAFILTLKAREILKSVRESSRFINVSKTYVPNMHNHNCYASLFMIYKELYKENQELFKKRKEVFEKIGHYRKQVLSNL